jgi:hypothetical protein
MRDAREVALATVLGLVLLLGGCSDPSPDAPLAGGVHPESWIDPGTLGTDGHHGTVATDQGAESCKACHGNDLNGSGEIPGCSECHFGPEGSRIPPGEDWRHGTSRHGEFGEFQATCNRCHDLRRSFGFEPQQCHNCHGPGLPHPFGQAWLDQNATDFHGSSTLDCADCHNLEVRCSECHFGVTGSRSPAGVGWTHGTIPHEVVEAYEAVCNRCHGLTRDFRSEPGNCHDCHDGGVPHSTGAS